MGEGIPTNISAGEDSVEAQFNKAFQKALSGSQINEKVGSWHLSNLNNVRSLELFYQDMSAIYSFQIGIEESSFVLWNSHREAKTGKGTESLQDLERKVASIANTLGKRVKLIFPKFGQKDTAKWLEKNGYSYRSSDDAYEKEFSL